MLGFAQTAGFGAAAFELDGDVFELVADAHGRDSRPTDHAALHRVLFALAQREHEATGAVASLGLALHDVEFAVRTGLLTVVRHARPVAPLDPVEIIDLVALASA